MYTFRSRFLSLIECGAIFVSVFAFVFCSGTNNKCLNPKHVGECEHNQLSLWTFCWDTSVSERARLDKLVSAVRETGVSWHFWIQMGPPLTLRYHSAVITYHLGAIISGPPIGTSLLDSYTSGWCCFCSLLCVFYTLFCPISFNFKLPWVKL